MNTIENIEDFDGQCLDDAIRLFAKQYWEAFEYLENHGIDDAGFLLPSLDYLAGMAFVSGQKYINAVRGVYLKIDPDFLALGPACKGHFVASFVYAGANYWKHSDEGKFNKETVARLQPIGLHLGTSYFTHELLTHLEYRIDSIATDLRLWRQSLYAGIEAGEYIVTCS